MSKKLSNPFSTGGGGHHFEAHVQASFVALMLTGGYAPAMPCWPIVKIKLQGKVDGYNTDDLIVFSQCPSTGDISKLIGQVKHGVRFTNKDKTLSDVISAAWTDFNDPTIFKTESDKIALITGPLNETDLHNVVWILDQARHSENYKDFTTKVNKAYFSPPKATEKLDVFRFHLKAANGNTDISDDTFYLFLKCFFLLGYDLGKEAGVVLSLLHSHISQFDKDRPAWAWSRVVDIVQTWNQDSGTITAENLPVDLRNAFKRKIGESIPVEFAKPSMPDLQSITASPSELLAIATAAVAGSWDDKSDDDMSILRRLADGF